MEKRNTIIITALCTLLGICIILLVLFFSGIITSNPKEAIAIPEQVLADTSSTPEPTPTLAIETPTPTPVPTSTPKPTPKPNTPTPRPEYTPVPYSALKGITWEEFGHDITFVFPNGETVEYGPGTGTGREPGVVYVIDLPQWFIDKCKAEALAYERKITSNEFLSKETIDSFEYEDVMGKPKSKY